MRSSNRERESSGKNDFKIDVFVRFKNGGVKPPDADTQVVTKVRLPLHQKVQLLKDQFPGISTNEAMKCIMRERGLEPLDNFFENDDCH